MFGRYFNDRVTNLHVEGADRNTLLLLGTKGRTGSPGSVVSAFVECEAQIIRHTAELWLICIDIALLIDCED